MAKVGEGDPRWVVQNREDGKNVNNWHWSETDCASWAKKHLTALLSDLTVVEDPEVDFCKTKQVQTVSGECTANIRKGKTIFFYEMEVKVPWEGKLKNSDVTSKGQITIPYISEEHEDDKMEVRVSCDTEENANKRLVSLLHTKGIPVVQAQVAAFLKDLRERFSVKSAPPAESQNMPAYEQAKPTTASDSPTPAPSSKSTKTIKIQEQFKGAARDVYNSMVDPNMLNAIMPGSTMSPSEGGAFSLLGGTIVGENVKLVPGAQIVQKWRFSSWPEGHFSTVTMDFQEKKGETKLSLTQTNVPNDEAERTEQGWRQNIWGRAKVMFGFGGMLF